MNKQQNIINVLSSIQMNAKDKSKLAKLLTNGASDGMSDVDVISTDYKEIDEIIEIAQKYQFSSEYPLFTRWGLPCTVYGYKDEFITEFERNSLSYDPYGVYMEHEAIYDGEYYQGFAQIFYDELIILENDEIIFEFKDFDLCVGHNFQLRVADDEGSYIINLNYLVNPFDNIITCIGDLDENEIIRIELDFNNYSTSYEIISKSQASALIIRFGEYVDDLKNKVTEAIHNGTPLLIGNNNIYECVLKATCYNFDYGDVYLYTDYGKYEISGNTIYQLDTYEKLNIITINDNTNFNELKQKILLSSILRYNHNIYFVYAIMSNYIEAFGINTVYRNSLDIPNVFNLRIDKDSTNGKCKIKEQYIPNEPIIEDYSTYHYDNISIHDDIYTRIGPTKDLSIEFTNKDGLYSTPYDGFAYKYIGEIIFADTIYNITFNNVIWSTDSILEFKPNHTYRFEIQCGLGVMKEYANQ